LSINITHNLSGANSITDLSWAITKTTWSFVNGNNGETGNITFYQRDDDPEAYGIPNKFSEIFDDGKIVKGFWFPGMTNQLDICGNYKDAAPYSQGNKDIERDRDS
jgi:hypothetical protein